MGRAAVHTGKMVTWDDAVKSEFQYVDDIDSLTFDTTPPIREDANGIFPAPVPGVTVFMRSMAGQKDWSRRKTLHGPLTDRLRM